VYESLVRRRSAVMDSALSIGSMERGSGDLHLADETCADGGAGGRDLLLLLLAAAAGGVRPERASCSVMLVFAGEEALLTEEAAFFFGDETEVGTGNGVP
jgi:hypothetical protein